MEDIYISDRIRKFLAKRHETDSPDEVYMRLCQKKMLIDREYLWEKMEKKMMNITDFDVFFYMRTKKIHELADHQKRSRYTNLFSYDHNNVRLKPTEANKHGYINATFINFPKCARRSIITCVPIPSQYSSFWQMVMENKVPGIVLLSDEGISTYFPLLSNESKWFGEYQVICDAYHDHGTFIHRDLTVKHKEEEHKLKHVNFLKWAAVQFPNFDELIQFREYVKGLKILPTQRPESGWFQKPNIAWKAPIIQCSDGVCRSGTFTVIDVMLAMLELRVKDHYSVEQTIIELRKQRRMTVTEVIHQQFVYRCVMAYIQKLNPRIVEMDDLLRSCNEWIPRVGDIIDGVLVFIKPEKYIVDFKKRNESIISLVENKDSWIIKMLNGN